MVKMYDPNNKDNKSKDRQKGIVGSKPIKNLLAYYGSCTNKQCELFEAPARVDIMTTYDPKTVKKGSTLDGKAKCLSCKRLFKIITTF